VGDVGVGEQQIVGREVRRPRHALALRPQLAGPTRGQWRSRHDGQAIRGAGVKIGIDPLGGAAVRYWEPIIERYGLNATLIRDEVDPTFRFMTLDWDGKIRMDCSSPYAMAQLIGMREEFHVAFANDTDADRHGIVTRSNGLMNPNHFLAASIAFLFEHRPQWRKDSAVGKTIVSSAIIDRVAKKIGRPAARPRAIMSLTDCAALAGPTTSMRGDCATKVIGAKSLIGS